MIGILDAVKREATTLRDAVIEDFLSILSVKAVNPSMGGEGEFKRGELLFKILSGYGLDVLERVDVHDCRVPEGLRPNIIGVIRGANTSRSVWIVSHLDTVPEGDLRLWSTDPFKPVVKDGRIYARGAEDNGQAIASSMLALKVLGRLNVKPRFNFGVVFVSDEEAGSQYGLKHLIDRGLFKPEDLVIVPDSGSPDGSEIEVAEKSILWLKITTHGRQTHGSTPHKGLNAHRAGMRFTLRLDEYLHKKYSGRDPIFTPQESTFEPTRKDPNVTSINTIPGIDTVYFDCRILPRYSVDEVLEDINKLKAEFEGENGVRIDVEIVMRDDSPPPTPEDSEVVTRLREAIEISRGVKPRTIGIGGGTAAAFFRRRGIPAAVWSTIDELAHQPNEYAKIENIVADAIVFTLIPLL